jgi:hypothetical protein
MFNGAPVTVTSAGGQAVVTITGNGTLDFGGGGTLTIQRATPGNVRVVVH